MKPPRDLEEALDGYSRFTEFDPQEVGLLEGLQIPEEMVCLGDAVHILYKSDKWEEKFHEYIHEHEAGVKVYVPMGAGLDLEEEEAEETPDWLQEVTSVYMLGLCIGFRYERDGKELDAEVKPHPELYAIPSGKALLLIDVQGSRAKVVAALWGGSLDVRPEGIVG